jgi:zinc transport system substrate-binding protein
VKYLKLSIVYAFTITYTLIANAWAADRIPVFVSITPQKYFVQQIGKDRVDVQVMVAPGASPATYEPRPRQMAALSKTALYFAIGVPFEAVWLDKIAAANARMKVVHTDAGIIKIPMAAHPHSERSSRKENHQPGEDHHERGGLDPHIWLSPPLVKQQARTICSALQQADSAHRDAYEANYNIFAAAIDRLNADLSADFANAHGLEFMVFHPSWGYFARTYKLQQIPIEIEGKEPKPAELIDLIARARKRKIKVIFVQPQFSSKSARQIAAEIGGQVVVADPLAADWPENLRAVANRIKAALR